MRRLQGISCCLYLLPDHKVDGEIDLGKSNTEAVWCVRTTDRGC